MALLVPDVGEERCLKAILNHTAPQDLVICLYISNSTPTESDVTGTYTEASSFGYVNKTLTGASWSVTPGAPTVATYAQQSWVFTGNLGLVYGYFVKQLSSGILMWSERFTDGPYNVVNNGDEIRVSPRIEIS
jgi:hypothetical protein